MEKKKRIRKKQISGRAGSIKRKKPANGKKSKLSLTKRIKMDRYAEWLTMSLEEKKERYNTYDADGKLTKEMVKKGTDKEASAIIGVRNEELSRWKNEDQLYDLMNWHMRRFRAFKPAVIRGLIRNCISKGMGMDVKTYLEIVDNQRFDGRGRNAGAKALEEMAGAMENGDIENASAKVNEDGSVDLTMRLKKYEDLEEGKVEGSQAKKK